MEEVSLAYQKKGEEKKKKEGKMEVLKAAHHTGGGVPGVPGVPETGRSVLDETKKRVLHEAAIAVCMAANGRSARLVAAQHETAERGNRRQWGLETSPRTA